MTQMKNLLDQTTFPKRGAFGKALVRFVLTREGLSVLALNRDGADMEIKF